MRKVPLLMKRLNKKKQLFYVICSDYEKIASPLREQIASPLRDGEFGDDLPSYSQCTSFTKCCHCTHHISF